MTKQSYVYMTILLIINNLKIYQILIRFINIGVLLGNFNKKAQNHESFEQIILNFQSTFFKLLNISNIE